MTTRVAIYTRISTDESNQEYSLPAQTADCDAYVARRTEWTIVDRYSDQKSAATLDRPGLQALLVAAANGDFDVLLVARLDRLSRDEMGWFTLHAQLQAFGVTLDSVADNVDLDTISGQLMTNMMMLWAAHERRLTRDRVIKGNLAKAKQGRWVGGPPPFGYSVDRDRQILVPREDQAAVVRRIFRWYVDEGESTRAIARQLNADGVETRRRRPWSGNTVVQVLKRGAYAGYIVHRGSFLEGQHEPLVDRPVWDRAQEILRERGAPQKRTSPGSSYLLTGLLSCRWCGARFIGKGARARGSLYRYYTCRRTNQYGQRNCSAPSVRADYLEEAVTDLIVEVYARTDLLQQAVHVANDDAPGRLEDLDGERAAAVASLAKVDRHVELYMTEFEDERLPGDALRQRLEELAIQRGQIASRITKLDAELNAAKRQAIEATTLAEVAELLSKALTEGARPLVKRLLAVLVDQIYFELDGVWQPVLKVPIARSDAA